jgi:uncharacterized delta-60 repeat protein
MVAAYGIVLPASISAQPFHLDPTFGTGGIVIEPASMEWASAVLVQPDGKILAAGRNDEPGSIVARYLPSGNPDPAFTSPSLPMNWVNGIALQSDGRIVLAGFEQINVADRRLRVARLLENGTPDPSFDGDGVAMTDLQGDSDLAQAVAIQSDGKIVVSGTYRPDNDFVVVLRYLTDGTPDPAFGLGGAFLGPQVETPQSDFFVDSQGRIVLGSYNFLMRLQPNGVPDAAFSVTLGPFTVMSSIAPAADDATLVVGVHQLLGGMLLERYTAAGSLDGAFGDGGRVIFGSTGTVSGQAGLVLPDGRIYVAGRLSDAFLLSRFEEDGDIDDTFGPGGFQVTPIGQWSIPQDLAVQSDGGVILAGYAYFPAQGSHSIALARYAACVVSPLPAPTIASVVPSAVSSVGGEMLQITGTNFDPGAEVRIGDAVADLVAPASPGLIDVTTRVQSIGLVDVLVRNADCQTAIMTEAVFVHPADVPPTSAYFAFVRRLVVNEVTSGCGLFSLSYCPLDPVTRAQMAVFLLRSKEGSSYEPPPATGTVFADVPIDGFAAAWIEELAARNITAGCDVNLYCPDQFITRAQMAVFLLVTLEGTGYQPPDPDGIFLDVPVSSPYARWIEEIFARGITSGCGQGIYCPNQAVLREQMAVFLSVTFNLPG